MVKAHTYEFRDSCENCKFRYYKTTDYPCAICTVEDDGMYLSEPTHWSDKRNQVQDSGERTQFESGAVRDMHEGKGRCDLLPMCVMLRLARHYEAGAKKYTDRNWEQGIPAHSFADSALRHMFKYMDGQTDEDHLIAAIWNLCGLAWTEEKKPEMMDIPARQTKD